MPDQKSKVILGLDIGSNSIGWGLVKNVIDSEDPAPPMIAGVRVFPEGVDRDQTGGEVSKNEARRIARGMRRQIQRRALRKNRLRAALVQAGLYPADPVIEKSLLDSTDPYILRARALTEKLSPHELGRVLLHLNQRRGFLSNRKTDGGKKEASETLAKISQLETEMGEATLGQHLAHLHSDPHARIRGRHTRRDMFLKEFEKIWEAQRPHHPGLLTTSLKYGSAGLQTYPQEPSAHKKSVSLLEKFGIHGLIFNQRPMYWPASVIGRCELERKEKRAPRAHRRFQYFRILQEVNHIRIIGAGGESRPLTDIQRSKLLNLLATSTDAPFEKIRKLLDLHEGEMFNLERGERKKLDGHKTDAFLSQKKYFGKDWAKLPDTTKDEIVESLLDDDEATVIAKATSRWGCSAELASALAAANLPDGYASFSLKAIDKLLPYLEKGMLLMANDETDSALHAAGYLRRDQLVANPRATLPPIPNDITNPLVRQALREVRKLVNAIIREFGRPDAIHLELAREVQGGADQRAKTIKTQRDNEKRREIARAAIEALGFKATREAITRYSLWQDQKEHCLYSGRHISPNQLFGGEVDVDHILPYSRSLDDSQANKIVCFRSENADKGNRTPAEWLAQSNPQRFEAILQRTRALPQHARQAKLTRMAQKEVVLDDFIARQLTDTAYITRKVHEYLRQLGIDVVCVKGRHTAELRNIWGINDILRDDGLNLKNREDHRHHAVDAIVIALTSRSSLQSLAHFWKLKSEFARDALRQSLIQRFAGFRDQVAEIVNLITVSHKPRRKVTGALHEETIYGPTHKPEKAKPGARPHAAGWVEEPGTYVLTKPLKSLTLAEVQKIRDPQVRALVCQRLKEFNIDPEGKAKIPPAVWDEPLRMIGRKGPEKSPNAPVINKVRIIKNDLTIRPIRGGKAWVKPGNTHHICIFEIPGKNGKKTTRDMVSVPMIDAIRRAQAGLPVISKTHPTNPEAIFRFSLSWGAVKKGSFYFLDE